MGNLMDSMKKAQEMAKNAEAINKELAVTTIMGSDPAGQVFATFNGLGQPIGINRAYLNYTETVHLFSF
jgi:DNA-binding protein YbaB